MKYSVLIIIYFLASYCNSNNITNGDVVKKWENLEVNLKTLIDKVFLKLQPLIQDYYPELNISDQCRESLNILVSGIRKMKTWAISFLDTSGTPTSSIMSGALSSEGMFQECIQIAAPNSQFGSSLKSVQFRGKYCTIKLAPPLPPKPKSYFMSKPLLEFIKYKESESLISIEAFRLAQVFYFLKFRYGVCIPSTCEKEDLEEIIETVKRNTVPFTSEVSSCEMEEEIEVKKEQIVSLVFLSFPVIMAIVGTSVDIYLKIFSLEYLSINRKQKKVITRVLITFSAYSNLKKLFSTSRPPNSLSCLHGIRFFSMTWVILGHTYYFGKYEQVKNLGVQAYNYVNELSFTIVLNATVSVDTFFFISGVLVSYVVLEGLEKIGRKSINIPAAIIHRIWRIWPSTIAIICMTFLLPWIGSGPYWHETIDPVVENCKNNWWMNLLFINNFIPGEKACLIHTWYSAADSQLYLISLFLITLLIKYPSLAFAAIASAAIIFMVITGYLTNYFEIPPTMLYETPDPQLVSKMMNYIYFQPYGHGGVYCIGLSVGYLLHKYRRININRVFKAAGWIVAITCNMTILLGSFEWNKGKLPGPVVSSIYAATHRTAWGIGLAWLTVMCCTGNCKIVNKFLSWEGFIPLSRLTFTAYLLHYLVIILYGATLRYSVHTSHFIEVKFYLNFVIITYLCAIIGSTLFESPYLALEKLYFKRRGIIDDSKNDNQDLSIMKTNQNEDVSIRL